MWQRIVGEGGEDAAAWSLGGTVGGITILSLSWANLSLLCPS